MENKNNYKEEKFDSFLNKTIILSSKKFYKRQINKSYKEKTIIDKEDYAVFFQDIIDINNNISNIDYLEESIELNIAIKSLSAIEQAVIFLLYQEGLTQEETAEILKIWRASVDRIKKRAIEKLRKHMKGDADDEE